MALWKEDSQAGVSSGWPQLLLAPHRILLIPFLVKDQNFLSWSISTKYCKLLRGKKLRPNAGIQDDAGPSSSEHEIYYEELEEEEATTSDEEVPSSYEKFQGLKFIYTLSVALSQVEPPPPADEQKAW